jgi:hypothetical protein
MPRAKTKEKEKPLNPNQMKFCYLYAANKECYGNAIKSYAIAYEREITKESYQSIAASASQELTNFKIQKKIHDILIGQFKDDVVDREHVRVILQDGEMGAKVQAIREYNKLKQRVTDKMEVHNTFSLTELLNAKHDEQK